jgi:O-acetyl-ADP-ribose deacetylase (regulator of RNase III)
MAISYSSGDLLEQKVDAIVNTVNTVGVMGKGVALQFKRRWPDNFKAYERACKADEVNIGRMFVYDTGGLVFPKYIINFPTKKHWRSPSKIEYIKEGLVDLIEQIRRLEIHSIALPPLGCGNGGLDWADVKPLVAAAFAQVPDVDVRVYPPSSQRRQLVAEAVPLRMTPGRAAMVSVLAMYQRLQYALTQIEVQKLAYFLSVSGENLNLKFVKHKYGPYAAELTHVLVKMEGAYLTGLGDLDSPSEIRVEPAAVELATAFLNESGAATASRVERISRLIEGYETPFGMELLATVHWAADQIGPKASLDTVCSFVGGWNERKRKLMSRHLVERAFERLHSERWLNS